MKTAIRNSSIILLYFVGISALVGGWNLTSDPSGKAMQLPLELLKNTPFQDFFYPGLILLSAVGIGCVIVGSLVILKAKYYPVLILVQGFVLTGWIVIQGAMLGTFNWLSIFYGTIGVYLILASIYLYEWHVHVNISGRSPYSKSF